MANYTQVFDGAALDAADDPILGVDIDTELDLIVVAVATKAAKVSAPTDGNLISQTLTGDIEDSGVAGANVSDLTSELQTQLATIIEKEAIPTGFVRGANCFLVTGSLSLTDFDMTAVADLTAETVGPTGSGATNIWADLDHVPSTANAILVQVVGQIASGGAVDPHTIMSFVKGDITPVSYNAVRSYYLRSESNSSGQDWGRSEYVIIPITSAGLFKAYVETESTATHSNVLRFRGYFVD